MANQIPVNVYAIDGIPQPSLAGIEIYLPTKEIFIQEYEAQNNPHVRSLITNYPNPNSRSKTQEFQVWQTTSALETSANTDGNTMFGADIYSINQSFLKNGAKRFLFPNEKPSIWPHEDGDIHSFVTFKGNDYYANQTKTELAEAANEGGDSGGGVESVVAGSGIDVDDTDPANPVVSATGGSYLVASVELTDAQIKALPTTSIVIVPAQGVGKTMLVLWGVLRWNSNSSVYTNINQDGTISIGYGVAETGEFIDHAASPATVWGGTGIRTSVSVQATGPHGTVNNPDIVYGFYNNFVELDFNNSSLVLWVDNQGSGNLTGGNAANTLKATVYYIVHDL